jgi:hypothetical protein
MRYLVVVLALVSACGLDRNIENKVTIDQGVYGLLIEGCDTSGCQDQPAAGTEVLVYAAGQNGAAATTTSDTDGVYQIPLPPGDYMLCTYNCTTITVPDAARVRYDWTSGQGGGDWQKL